MTATEHSLKILLTDPTSREGMEEGRSGKHLQRKCLAIITPGACVTLHCCLIIIVILLIIVTVLSTLVATRRANLVPNVLYVTCPKGWIGFGNKCFYFSEDTRNWTFSHTFCTLLKADLAQFETEEELNFLKRYKGPLDHWIGLSRESSYHVWKWTDSTEYKAWFPIKGSGECAYLDDTGVSSARSYTDRNWICSKTNNNVSYT
ncbi:C-type lectin domain family 2 member E-like [Hippopotamus amphibius kiboko]|uniref:C-type lectin domain family 2 member E-like n=1 Tax=Hippopotamus amphibius kiboko TaxID=575201 RepID=UPI002598A88C|nr:C-type lectin domain family 2 member E-like [Hippopotamus amphibius kiboko]